MATKEQVIPFCLTISAVPKTAQFPELQNLIQYISKGQCYLLQGDVVTGVEPDESLTRWVVLLSNPTFIPYVCDKVGQVQFPQAAGQYIIKFERTVACEVPECFLQPQVPQRQFQFSATSQASAGFNQVAQGTFYQNYPPSDPNQSPVKETGPQGGADGNRDQQPENGQQYEQKQGPQSGDSQIPTDQQSLGPQGPSAQSSQGPVGYEGPQAHQYQHMFYQDTRNLNYPMYGAHFQFQQGMNQQGMGPYPPYPNQGYPGPGPGPGHRDSSPYETFRQFQKGQQPEPEPCKMPFSQTSPKGKDSDPPSEETDDVYMDARSEYPREEPSQSTFVKLIDIPKTATKERLISFLEDVRKQGVGEVKSLDINSSEATAVVEFVDPVAVQKLLQMSRIKFSKRRHITAVAYEPPEEIHSCTVEVTGLPPNASRDALEMYFESKKRSCGDTVTLVDIRKEEGLAYVTFESEEVAQRVASKSDHTLDNQPLEVRLYTLPGSTSEETKEEDDSGPIRTLQVTGMDENITRDLLEMYFESKRKSGGGDIEELEFEAGDGVAYVTFVSDEVAARVLERESHVLSNVALTVELCDQSRGSNSSAYSSSGEEGLTVQQSIEVRGFRPNMSMDMLQMYFESKKRSNGGPVENFEVDEEEGVVLVTFELEEDAQRVVEKSDHVLDNQSLEVSFYKPKRKKKVKFNADSASEEEEDESSLRTIEVRGCFGNISEEMLEMYFENKRKSGGGDIETFRILDDEDGDDDVAHVTFESAEVAARVVEKGEHVLSGEQLDVKLYRPPKQKPSRKKKGKIKADSASEDQTKPKPERKPRSHDKTKSETEPPPEPICTVKVLGWSAEKSSDTLHYYFENTKRSGGGEVLDTKSVVEEEEDQYVIYLKFETEEVARRVAGRSHQVEGLKLTVELYVPPPPVPSYDDRIFISNMKTSTTKDCLFNFLEAKTQVSPEKLLYGERDGTVVVIFEEPPDIEKLQDRCRATPLEGSYLTIDKVPYTNCIHVANCAPSATLDTLKFYFENKRRSGGGEVIKVVQGDQDFFLVYFHEYEAVDSVVDRTHKVEGMTLTVQPFIECLGCCQGDGTEPKLKIPDPVQVKELNQYKVKFLKKATVTKAAVENQLHACNAKILWPEKSAHPIVLECTVQEKDKDARKQVRDWAKSCQASLSDFMNTIEVLEVSISEEIRDFVMVHLESLDSSNSEAVAVFFDKDKKVIRVVGISNFARELCQKITDIRQQAIQENENRKQQIKETKTDIQNLKLRMLLAAKYPATIEEKFKGLKVKINQNKNEINFEGRQMDVRSAQVEMYEQMAQYEQAVLDDVPGHCLQLYQNKQVKEYIVKTLKNKHIVGVWEVTDTKLTVCSFKTTLNACVELVQGCLKAESKNTHTASRTVLASRQWKEKVEELHERFPGRACILTEDNGANIMVCSTDDINSDLSASVRKFLRHHTVLEQTVPVKSGIVKLLHTHHKKELNEIVDGLGQYFVQITPSQHEHGFLVKGTEDGLEQASSSLNALVRKVQIQEHETKKPGLVNYIQSAKGKESIKMVETDFPCVIQVKGQEEEIMSHGRDGEVVARDSVPVNVRRSNDGSGPRVHAECRAYDGRMVYTVEGDMTGLVVDVLVNTSDKKLNMLGGLAKAIIAKGGRQIAIECETFVKAKGTLDEGQIFCSSAGTLPCSMVVHVVGPQWHDGTQGERDALRETIFNSMRQTSNRSLKSIAFPAISCGAYGYPAREATKVIADAVKDFFREMQDSPVMAVYLCDVKTQTVQYFTEALGNAFGKSEIKYLPKPGSRPVPTKRQSKAAKYSHSDSDDDEDSHFILRPVQRERQGTQMSLGNISIKIVKDEMAKQKVDIIVNTTAKNLDLKNGAVSASLLSAGGPTLQQEVNQNYPNGLKSDGDIAVTSGANLHCMKVFHTSLMSWDGGSIAEAALRNLVLNCLELADKHKASSVAFPAIGTGNLNFPRDVVAKQMFQAVSVFSGKHQGTKITDVRFVLYHKDMQTIKAFEMEEGRWSGGSRMGQRQGRTMDRTALGFSSAQVRAPEVNSDEDVRDEDSDGDQDTLDVRVTGDSQAECQVGSISVKIEQGDITRASVNCIVNSSNEELDLNRGGVSKAILQQGGKRLQDEVKLLKSKMKKKHVVMTSAPGLSCDKVIHIVAQESLEDWKKVIDKCLKEAERKNIKSLAFPALGTGMNTAPSDIARVLISAIQRFEPDSQSVSEIRIIVFQGHMVQDFIEALKQDSKQQGFMGKLWSGAKSVIGSFTRSRNPEARTARPKQMKETAKVVFMIFAMERGIIQSAIRKLDKILEGAIINKIFNDSVIRRFTDDQVREIVAMGQQRHVEIQADVKNGKIIVTGTVDSVMDANDAVHTMIRDVDRFEQQKSEAEMLVNLVQWFYIEITTKGQDLQKYETELNYQIEKAYKDQQSKCVLKLSDGNYIVDFSTMEEYPEKDPKDTVQVIRRDLIKDAKSELPATWSSMGDAENLKVVTLQNSDPEWKAVEAEFKKTCQGNFTVTKVDRIQNKTLYQQYQAKKKLLDQQNPPGTINERKLWHGTAAETVDSINAHGFNRSYCGKNATVHGDGVYFAVNASYSCQNTYSRPDSNNIKNLYLCVVLTGEYTAGQRGMRVLPTKPQPQQSASGTSNQALYDSVVDNTSNPGMFIIFHDTQAYPEYLIKIKQ